MKSLIALLQEVLADAGTRCGTSTSRDLKEIAVRSEHEGVTSFLAITLPSFATDLQKGLAAGECGPDLFPGFQKRGRTPVFLGGFMDLVFDRASGQLLPDTKTQVDAIRAIRQICRLYGKIELRCSPERVDAAYQLYLQTEQDVRQSDAKLVSAPEEYRLKRYARIGRLLWADFFSKVDSRIYQEGVTPKHGPGATADKLRGNAKYEQLMWTRRLEEVFPWWENIFPNDHPRTFESEHRVTILEPWDEIPVRVIDVPKTLKTPRLIAIEPTCMQYMQQGILAVMVEEMSGFTNPAHLLDFESQEPNQRLAREGSISGALATLDLSEASDRVSNQHVRILLANHRELRRAVDATRSRKADVLGETIRLAKFASMGSALTFPFESIVFMTMIFCGIEECLGRPLTQEDVTGLYGRVRTYGDDIIVPVEYVHAVMEELEAFGLRVNRGKSFWTGLFRESCGSDWYAGEDVSSVRARHPLPNSRLDVVELQSAVSLRNAFKSHDWDWLRTIGFLDDWISGLIPFPFVEPTSVLLGRQDDSELPRQEFRPDYNLHYPLVWGSWVESRSPASPLDDRGALMKFHLKRSTDPFEDREHLQRAGRPQSAHIKTGWRRPW